MNGRNRTRRRTRAPSIDKNPILKIAFGSQSYPKADKGSQKNEKLGKGIGELVAILPEGGQGLPATGSMLENTKYKSQSYPKADKGSQIFRVDTG